jgi:hypothetical protein
MEDYREWLLTGNSPRFGDFRKLWKVSGHPDAQVREAALILLGSPPVEDEILYLRGCTEAALRHGRTRLRDMPPAMYELLFDLWEHAAAFGVSPPDDSSYRSMLERLPLAPLLFILQQPYSLQAFLPHLGRRLAKYFHASRSPGLKRKWRLFKSSILRRKDLPGWRQPTFVDLQSLFVIRRKFPKRRVVSGGWLIRARPLLFPEAKPRQAPSFPPMTRVTWARNGNLSLSWLEALLRRQARELASIRDLAREVSRRTRRVVFSWHNASLAAAGGWAFEDLDAAFPSRKLWSEFSNAVNRGEAWRSSPGESEQTGENRLWQMREERLILPRIQQGLYEACALRRFDSAWERVCEAAMEQVISFMAPALALEVVAEEKRGWHGPGSPAQRCALSHLLEWWKGEREAWSQGLARLSALAAEASRLLAAGDLECFVLPWIDKFFISSRRRADCLYLPALVRWLEDRGEAPLVLFWEDTIHATLPSFRLAMEDMRSDGALFHGIGVFGPEMGTRRDALDLISRSLPQVRLFALRPWDDSHCAGSFHRMLKSRDSELLEHYDSSWKDNLSFLYAGTEVSPLVSDPGYRETLPSWVTVGHEAWPFGAFFRGALRERVLGRTVTDSTDGLSARYAHWANLR